MSNSQWKHASDGKRLCVNRSGYLQGSILVLALAALARPVMLAVNIQELEQLYVHSWIIALVGLWAFWSWRQLNGSLLHPYIILFTTAFAFHGIPALLNITELSTRSVSQRSFAPEIMCNTFSLVSICLASLHVGALIGCYFTEAKLSRQTTSDYSIFASRRVALLLLVCCMVPTVITLVKNISLVQTSGYFAIYQAEAASGLGGGVRVLAAMFIPSVFYCLVLSRSNTRTVAMLIGLLLVYCGATLYVGGRGPAAVTIACTVWLVDRCIRRVPRSALLAGAVVLLALFSLVRAVRMLPGYERSSLSMLYEQMQELDEPVVATLEEMGGTMNIVSYVQELVPAQRPFEWGLSYLRSATAIIPNLFWELHPAVASGTLSQWLIQIVDPSTAAAGGTIGFSFVAEAYLNFGLIGSPFVMGLMGLVFGALCRWGNDGGDVLKIAMIAGITAMSLSTVRNDSTATFRVLLWYGVAPYLFLRFAGRFRSLKRFTLPNRTSHSAAGVSKG